MKFKRSAGITLIALVVTIIVLLILAGVTLSLALNSNGVLQRGKNAASTYREAEEEEQRMLEQLAREMKITGEGGSGGPVLPPVEIPDTLKEGDIVTYSPNGEFHWDAMLASDIEESESDLYNMIDKQLATGSKVTTGKEDMSATKWQVLKIDDVNKKVVIVPKTQINNQLMLGDSPGYSNAVKLLNDACSALYGNNEKGVTARNINIEDIEEILLEEDVKNGEGNTLLSVAKNSVNPIYGNRKEGEYSDNHGALRDSEGNFIICKRCPVIYAKEKYSIINGILNSNGLGVSEQNTYINRTDKITIGEIEYSQSNIGNIDPTSIKPVQQYYEMDYNTFANALGDKKDIILPNGDSTQYWIASRCTRLQTEYHCCYDVRGVIGGSLSVFNMADSIGLEGGPLHNCALFPVVTISSGTISGDATQGYTLTINE